MSIVENSKLSLRYCKNHIIDKGYLIGFTGKQSLCYDSDFNKISTFDKLKYVYNGDVSPNGENILLISNENRFSVHNFPNLELLYNISVKAPYNGNLEGKACWSFDGKKIFLCALNDETINSSLKVFDICSRSFEVDMLKEKYWLMHISRINTKKKYLLIGFNRKDLKTYLIWFDGENFTEHCLSGFDDVVTSVKYNELYDSIDVCYERGLISYDCSGNRIENKLLNVSGLDYMDFVTDMCASEDESILYIGTLKEVCVLDKETNKIIDRLTINSSVNKISEITNHKIIVSTWDGIRFFEYR